MPPSVGILEFDVLLSKLAVCFFVLTALLAAPRVLLDSTPACCEFERIDRIFLVQVFVELLKADHLSIAPACERSTDVGLLVIKVSIFLSGIIVDEIFNLFWTKITIDLVTNLLGLVLSNDWVELVSHCFAPEENTIDVLLTDPTLILVVRLASDRILRTLVPLLAARLLLLVAKHPLED